MLAPRPSRSPRRSPTAPPRREPTSSTWVWPPPTSSTSPRATPTRPARCSPPATIQPSTTASSSAGPARRQSGSRPDSPTSRPRVADGRFETSATPGRVERRDLLPEFVTHVRSFIDTDALAGQRIVADTANGLGGLIVPAVFDGLPVDVDLLFGELDGTFPNHPADPIQPENLRDLQARILERTPTSAWRSTATRTGCSSSTTAPSHSRAPSPPPSWPRRSRRLPAEASDADRTVVYNLICSKASPRSCASSGGRRCGAGSGTRSSSRSWQTPGPGSAGSTPATTTSGQLPRRLGHHRRARHPRDPRPIRGDPLRAAPPLRALRPVGGDQPAGPRPGRRRSNGSPPPTPPPPRTASTASPSTTAPGGSTCGQQHQSRSTAQRRGPPTRHPAQNTDRSPRARPPARQLERRAPRPKLLEILACPETGSLLYFADESASTTRAQAPLRVRDDIRSCSSTRRDGRRRRGISARRQSRR